MISTIENKAPLQDVEYNGNNIEIWSIVVDKCATTDSKDEVRLDFDTFLNRKVNIMMRKMGYFPQTRLGEKDQEC